MVVTAGAHPLNAVPVGGALVVLVTTGLFLAAFTLLLFDVLVLITVLRSSQVRNQLGRRADRRARRRAAERLGLATQGEWMSLDTAARRAQAFNPRHREVESLLDTFLNVALTHQYANECAETTAFDLDLWNGSAQELASERKLTAERTRQAIGALRTQLDTTAQRIRLACEVAVAEQCEAGADLWLSDVQEPRCLPSSRNP